MSTAPFEPVCAFGCMTRDTLLLALSLVWLILLIWAALLVAFA